MQIEIRHVEGQEVLCDVVGQMAIRFVGTAEVAEVASLAERKGLIGIVQVQSLLSDQVDEAMADIELGGDSSGMLFCY